MATLAKLFAKFIEVEMIDVQNQVDTRGIKIQRTGVSKVHLPLLISDGGKVQQVAAQIRFTVSLSEKIRGTHMSRLMEILTDWTSTPIKILDVEKILVEAQEKLDADFSTLQIDFKYFVEKSAPISEKKSFIDVDCKLYGELSKNSRMKFNLGLTVPFTSLCPCSREISDFGAHNQRSVCRVNLEVADVDKAEDFGIEKIFHLIELQGSSKVFPILKREDEKFVTESAYQNAKFVEDILRDVVGVLRGVENISSFEVECENFESIHNHNAYAYFNEELRMKN